MSLLDDLKSLDLSQIINARGAISASIQNPQLQAILQGGATQTALGNLGGLLGNLRGTLDEPESLIKPLVDAVAGLAEPLQINRLPMAQYLEAVKQGAEILKGVFEGLNGDPTTLGKFLGRSLTGAFDTAQTALAGYKEIGFDKLSQLRALVETVERGVPTNPAALAELAIEILLPFSKTSLVDIRARITPILENASAIKLSGERNAGLLEAFNAVTVAASAQDAGRVQQALQALERVRANTIASVKNDLLESFTQIGRLQVENSLAAVASVSNVFRTAESGILEFFEDWRAEIALARGHVESIEAAQITALMAQFLAMLEEHARQEIVAPIEAQVLKLEGFVRGLLRHLPLRSLRAEISGFIHSAAQAIQDAGLEGPANAARKILDDLQATIGSANLGDEIGAALQEVKNIIDAALGELFSALETISNEVNALAGGAQSILENAATALAEFQAAVDAITASVDNLGVEVAAQQVVDQLKALREKAEALLSVAPLPEPMRPLIEQLISTLEELDLEALVFAPVESAVADFDLSDEANAKITEGLAAARDALQNLIPAELIASIEKEINDALSVLRNFDPSSLLSGVTGFLNEIAAQIESLSVQSLVENIRGPFQTVLDLVDTVHPRKLLQPVIAAYDELLSNIPTPSPETAVRRVAEGAGAMGESVGRSAVESIRDLAPAGTVELASAPPTAESAEIPQIAGIRPGDVIRMFGYLPNKLRETLAGLTAGPAGEALRAIDDLCGSLARNLRRLQATLWEIDSRLQTGLEELLAPLGAAQLRAQLALQANFTVGTINVNASVALVAQAGPGPMRQELQDALGLACGRARQAATNAGGHAGAALEGIANALEKCRLSGLGNDIDAVLAALDPEPIAAELDALVFAVLKKAPGLLSEISEEMQTSVQKLKALINELNPGVQAQKFLRVLQVLREEIDVLNPRRLADELGEVHAAIRKTISAYDPAIFAAEIDATLDAVATSLRALNPAELLGELNFFDDIADRIEALVPTNALAGVGESLAEVGAKLSELDPGQLLEIVRNLAAQIIAAVELAVKGILNEIITLLKSLRFASGSAQASLEVTA